MLVLLWCVHLLVTRNNLQRKTTYKEFIFRVTKGYKRPSILHSGDLYSTSSRDYYSEVLPASTSQRRKTLERCKIWKGRQSEGLTTEKALHCIIAKRA